MPDTCDYLEHGTKTTYCGINTVRQFGVSSVCYPNKFYAVGNVSAKGTTTTCTSSNIFVNAYTINPIFIVGNVKVQGQRDGYLVLRNQSGAIVINKTLSKSNTWGNYVL